MENNTNTKYPNVVKDAAGHYMCELFAGCREEADPDILRIMADAAMLIMMDKQCFISSPLYGPPVYNFGPEDEE